MPFAESEPPSRGTEPTGLSDPMAEPPAPVPAAIGRWVKSECGRAKYQKLATRGGPWARLRLAWFVLIAALRDWRLPPTPST